MTSSQVTQRRHFNLAKKQYALGMMTLIVAFNYIDRGLITVLLEPIKIDLQLSDTQLGFLTGIAFGLFYASLGLPIARWADRGNRVTIASLAIGLWSVTVMSCLWVSSFTQLLLARIAASVGEAGCIPPTYSLVGDYFPEAGERTKAMSVYMLAGAIASLISFGVGGWLSEQCGWRWTFFLMGAPALVLAGIVKLTIEEPTRKFVVVSSEAPSTMLVLRSLWRQGTTRNMVVGVVVFWTMGLGMLPWYAAFLIRTHGMGTTEVGAWMGFICGGSGVIGVLLGGYAAVRWFNDDARGQLRLCAATIACVVPCYLLFLLSPQKYVALAAFVPLVMVFNSYLGPTFALMQRLVEHRVRATTMAVVMLFANLIGMGLGPLFVGTLSDALKPLVGADSLRYAMLTLSLTAWWAAYHFWQAGKTVRNDLLVVEKASIT